MNYAEEFFVKKSIKKFITLKIFSFICKSLTFWSNIFELLYRKFHRWNRGNIRSFKWNYFMTLAFYDMIFSKWYYFITLFNSWLIIDFLSDNFPFVIKSMLIVLVFRYKINKLWQWHTEDLIIKCNYFDRFLIFSSFH